jgi:hypothetical protein
MLHRLERQTDMQLMSAYMQASARAVPLPSYMHSLPHLTWHLCGCSAPACIAVSYALDTTTSITPRQVVAWAFCIRGARDASQCPTRGAATAAMQRCQLAALKMQGII